MNKVTKIGACVGAILGFIGTLLVAGSASCSSFVYKDGTTAPCPVTFEFVLFMFAAFLIPLIVCSLIGYVVSTFGSKN